MRTLAAADFQALSEVILGRGHVLRFQVRGRSMFPAIREGDILEVQPLAGSKIRMGDIAFYRNAGGQLVAHRVIRKATRSGSRVFIMKGDEPANLLEEVRPTQILGRGVGLERERHRRSLDSTRARLKGYFRAYLSLVIAWLKRFDKISGLPTSQIRRFLGFSPFWIKSQYP